MPWTRLSERVAGMDAPVLMDIDQHAALPFPQSLPEFQRLFPDDSSCAHYSKWHAGRRFRLSALWCDWRTFPHWDPPGRAGMPQMPTSDRTDCRHGHGAQPHAVVHLVLGAYLVATQTPGMSAVQFQRQLGLSRYETAFQILHKLRAGMVRPHQDRIGGRANEHVEVDETWVGGRTRGEGRGVHHKVLVACAVRRAIGSWNAQDKRKDGRYAGRVRLAVAADRSARSLCKFVDGAVAPGR